MRVARQGIATMPDQYVRRAASFGFDFDTPQKNGQLEIIYLRPLDLSVDETVHEIVATVKKIGAKRLVIDSLVGFEMALAPGFRTDFRESLYRMIGALTRLGVTIISTVEIEEDFIALLEMQGGTVAVSSALGQGSEFLVRLPMVPPPEQEPLAPPTDKAQSTGPSLRVLVVDDNVDSATTLGLLVQASGHEIRIVYDGMAVLEAALDYRPHMVLLDIGLPGLNGFEVAERLRQQPALQNVVLVALTGYGQASDRQRSQEAGFDHHLVKPANFGQILQILATKLSKSIEQSVASTAQYVDATQGVGDRRTGLLAVGSRSSELVVSSDLQSLRAQPTDHS